MDELQQSAKFVVGDRVRVSDKYWDATIRGAIGVVSVPPEGIAENAAIAILWVEFDPWIISDDPAHPIEAGQVDADGLEPFEYPREAC